MFIMCSMALERLGGLFALAVTLLILADVNSFAGCRTGSFAECEEARFVPGHNLAGEGFDVVTMLRKGTYAIDVKAYLNHYNACTLCENPFHKGEMQRIPASVLDWRTLSRCEKEVLGALHHSVNSLVKSCTDLLDADWAMDLDLDETGRATLRGSRSEVAEFAKSQSSLDRTTFATHEISCTHYSYRLAGQPTLSGEFSKYLQELPRTYDHNTRYLYRQFIDTYGTHYVRQVELGGRVRRITTFRTCLATLQGFSETEIQRCLEIDLKKILGLFAENLSLNSNCSSILKDGIKVGFDQGFMTHKIEIMGGEHLYKEQSPSTYPAWLSSLPDKPDLLSYSIRPLHSLVSDQEVRNNLRRAVLDHMEDNKLETAFRKVVNCSLAPNLDYNCCPLGVRMGRLTVKVERATGLESSVWSHADGYVKVQYKGRYQQTETINNDHSPRWNTAFDFGMVELKSHQLTFEVWEDDMYYDDLLGNCSISPKKGRHSSSCQLNQGLLYFTYEVICDVHLNGYECEKYSPAN